MLLVFEATVYRHQSHHYSQLQRAPPTIPTLFASATRDTLDQGLVPCFKYLLNYSFYKFGLEVQEPGVTADPAAAVSVATVDGVREEPARLCTDLLPDDGECDWPADELPDDNPRLLAGGHPVEAAASSDRQAVAQLLRLPDCLHGLPVPAVLGHTTRPVHR